MIEEELKHMQEIRCPEVECPGCSESPCSLTPSWYLDNLRASSRLFERARDLLVALVRGEATMEQAASFVRPWLKNRGDK